MKIYYNPKLQQLARNLRNNSTLSEVLLWYELKGRKMMGYQFMRQKPIGDFIVDFYCSKLKLVIEVDGDSHITEVVYEKDLRKTEYLKSLGINVLRIDDLDVKLEISIVIRETEQYIEECRK